MRLRNCLRPALTFCLLLVSVAAFAAEPAPSGRALAEQWYEARTEQGKLGHVYFVARELEKDEQRLIQTRLREEWHYLRSGDPYRDSQELETLETPEGQIVQLAYVVSLSKSQKMRLVGTVQGNQLTFRIADPEQPFTQTIPWDRRAMGLFAERKYFEGKKLEPGQRHVLHVFQPVANRVLPVTYTVVGKDVATIDNRRCELVRVEQTFPKEAYLNKSTLWFDESGKLVKSVDDDPTLFGPMFREIATQEAATAAFEPEVADKEAPILVNKPINTSRRQPIALRLRFTREDDDEPATLFAEDGRQFVTGTGKSSVDLQLLKKAPPFIGPPAEAEPEYLESNFFIRSDDPLVKKLAKEAVGEVKNPKVQVELLRTFLRKRFRGGYEIAFAPADEVAKSMEGDCTEMGVLLAAMCRSLGIPARVAFGLVYDSENKGFGGHLWCEVYLDGEWAPRDPTRVVDSLHAAYVRVASYSLKNVLNPDEMVSVRRAFSGVMKVEVLEQP